VGERQYVIDKQAIMEFITKQLSNERQGVGRRAVDDRQYVVDK
jgi:hypothetical protein